MKAFTLRMWIGFSLVLAIGGVVIPMHYGALPGSSSEADIRAVVGNDARVKFMKPGETRNF
ncbi:MAG: hypothetical protein WBX14_04490 [Candidatus Udaeobacter sp.]